MSEFNHFYFDGKAVMPIDQFINLVGGAGIDGTKTSLVKLYATVSWLYRGVALLENGVSSMPFEIRRGEQTIYEFDPSGSKQDVPPAGLEFLIDIPYLSGMINGAAVLRGKAYIFNIKNGTKTLELRWFNPDTIDPKYDNRGHLISFTRTIQGHETALDLEDVLYFWPPDKFIENGPAQNYSGRAALASAGVLNSMDEFLRGYFDRGLVAAGFLKYETHISDDEKPRIKEWWDRLTGGVRKAFENLIVRGDFSYEQIGQGIKDLENTALVVEERESIATALGIPQSKMTQPPGGLGDTKTPDDLMFVTDTIIPACTWIARTWNRLFFVPRGLMLVYMPQKLSIMQEDETKRSQAFSNYIQSGMSIETAASILGIYIPDDMLLENETLTLERQAIQGSLTADSDVQDNSIDETKRASAFASYVSAGMSVEAAAKLLDIVIDESVLLSEPDVKDDDWLTLNEKRVAMGLAPVVDGDVIYLPSSLIPAIEVTE